MRFVTATNRDLETEIGRGRFRGDLFYRIGGVRLADHAALREHRSEIAPLAKFFLDGFCARSGIRAPVISEGAIATLESSAWPGNVRQLRNVMEQAPLLAGDGVVLLGARRLTTRSAPAQSALRSRRGQLGGDQADLFSPPTLVGFAPARSRRSRTDRRRAHSMRRESNARGPCRGHAASRAEAPDQPHRKSTASRVEITRRAQNWKALSSIELLSDATSRASA